MFNIIKSDLYRILRGKAIYIAFLVMVVMSGLSMYELSPGYLGASSAGLEQINEDALEDVYRLGGELSLSEIRKIYEKHPYEFDKEFLAANANLYYIFIVMVAIIIAADFSKRTIKNTVSSAVSRKKYYYSKLICCILICSIFVLINNYGTYFVNKLVNGENFSSSLGTITRVTLYQLPIMYGIISLLVCVSVVVKKGSAFNAISIPLLMAFQLLITLFLRVLKMKATILNYEYQTALGKLARNPENDYIVKCVLLGIFYIVIFNIIGYYSFKRAEIK
ncbi:MAG: ABC transporter permease subunit [Lachnospiraceae bacterium]|nr:ABC transporter permease subunit [Lachnospiraceae bacterium]